MRQSRPPSPIQPAPPYRRWRLWLAVTGLLGLLLVWHVCADLDAPRLAALMAAANPAGPQLGLLLLGLVVGHVLAIPFTVMVSATALLVPPVPAILLGWAGGIIGATLIYLLGKRLGGKRLGSHLPQRLGGRLLRRIDHLMRTHGIWSAFWLHAIPIAPALVVNLACGAARLRTWQFLLGTTLGLLPITVIVVLLTQGIRQTLSQPSLLAALGWLVAVLAVLGISLLGKRYLRRWWLA